MPPGHLVSVRKDVIFLDLSDDAYVLIQPASAHLAFETALAALPASGGVLYVMPGTAPYVFQNAVVVSKPGVRIEFTSGPGGGSPAPDSYLAFPSSGGPKELFRIEAPRFTCRAAYVRHVASNPGGADDGRSCFLVQPSPTQAPHDARFDRCTFDLVQDSASLIDFSAIRAVGASDRDRLAGLRVTDCSIVIGSGTASSAPTGSGSPRGIVGVRVEHVAQALVDGLMVRGEPMGAIRDTHCGSVLLLDDCPGSVLGDFSIRLVDLRSAASNVADAAIRLRAQPPVEAERAVVSRFVLEDIGCRTGVEVAHSRSVVVSNANFGRLLNASESAIEVSGSTSRDVAIHGMNFHNVSAGGLSAPPAPSNDMIVLASARNVSVSGIVFFPFDGLQGLLRTAPGQCVNIAIAGALSRLAKA